MIVPCGEPGCTQTFKNRYSAGQHRRNAHGVGYRKDPTQSFDSLGSSASYLPTLQKVPDELEKLPWIKMPRDPAELRRIADAIKPGSGISDAERTFWTSLKAHIEVLSRRSASA